MARLQKNEIDISIIFSILHLAEIASPRIGSASKEDEPWAFECREFLRQFAVGKPITFTATHSLPPKDGVSSDFGHAEIGGKDLATEVLRAGFARCKEIKREPTEDDNRRKEIETEARNSMVGMWNPQGPKNSGTNDSVQDHNVQYSMPADSAAFVNEWKGKNIDAIVEQVRDGSTLRVRLLMPEDQHQFANISLAGVRCPRAGGREGETAEEYGEEAKFFTESRILQRVVRVQILSLPAPTSTPFASTSTNAPAPTASIFIGNVLHPNGNIAEFLLAAGLARVIDWHAGMLAANGAMERLRGAEKSAKEKKLKLYSKITTPATASAGPTPVIQRGPVDATVIRVWSGDQVSIVEKEGRERRVQLSSVRAPKASEPKQAYYANEAREFLRKKLIGKHVKVNVDFVRPKEGDFEERDAVTIRYGNAQTNVAEQLIEKGLATALRHRRDDESRSSEYDKLMAAEQNALTEARGIHSGKEVPVPRIINASETSTKASSWLSSLKRQGRVPAVVDYVASGSRFKVLIPKENISLTLVLSGIRAPRTARNPSEKNEPYGLESLEFATRRYMQRDVEVDFEATDKTGGFIGALYLNKTENVAVTLVREGLATVHDYSAESLSWSRHLYDAEADAKTNKRNIWHDFDASLEQTVTEKPDNDSTPLKPEYLDVIISDIRTTPSFAFSIQVLNENTAQLEKMMKDFALHYRNAPAVSSFVPKAGELVAAKFSGDGQWYRAKVKRSSAAKKEAELTFVDYGNQETASFSNTRLLDPRFKALPPQAQDARLSFVKLAGADTEYAEDAIGRFRSLAEGRKLVANVDHKDGHVLHLRLIDPQDPHSANDPHASINTELVRDGLAMIDKKERYLASYPAMVNALKDATLSAKRERLGMYELGDIGDDDE
ncbi:Staphylococcal nuclease domain-containing protein 1 OS=Schizosaccharomyces pombe (strain 972 / ATCC 24843) GN=snd1 PE=1 SV=1 [Rhizoctonia solani AG-1 IB]|uniref:Staphylococcal nuclease domain-containing protein 1 n=1 Tax=Thanatephorus cucumeris (strain AG1-IB / isolate 7/3/14) TaxID=1108050 RepID=A0A0B7FTF3_THACB|nr:Staphylococcal nuclease domain-containing protein 1 OS=Schizosaccharomyces pombe (strain 972 / ATCC 24843) GN=snd1 PE=1 SV=1 [Rhizoctonia solani AG-1 IB]